MAIWWRSIFGRQVQTEQMCELSTRLGASIVICDMVICDIVGDEKRRWPGVATVLERSRQQASEWVGASDTRFFE